MAGDLKHFLVRGGGVDIDAMMGAVAREGRDPLDVHEGRRR